MTHMKLQHGIAAEVEGEERRGERGTQIHHGHEEQGQCGEQCTPADEPTK